jgi:hypothetical protein
MSRIAGGGVRCRLPSAGNSAMADGGWRMADGAGAFFGFAARRGAAGFFRVAFGFGLDFDLPVTRHPSLFMRA